MYMVIIIILLILILITLYLSNSLYTKKFKYNSDNEIIYKCNEDRMNMGTSNEDRMKMEDLDENKKQNNTLFDLTNETKRGIKIIPDKYVKNELLWDSVNSKDNTDDIGRVTSIVSSDMISPIRPLKGSRQCQCLCKYIAK